MNVIETYLLVLIRLVTVMPLLLFSILFIMGKRPIGELPVFDFLALVVIGSIVGADIADPNIEHLPTAFAIVVLAILQRLISFLMIHNKKVKRLFSFEPTIIIKNSKFIYKNIKKTHYTIEDILMLLREKEIFDISEIEYGIIEANGSLSILKKPEHVTVTVQDMNLPYPKSNLCVAVIIDGELQTKNLGIFGLDEKTILEKIKEQGVNNYKDIFYASIDSNDNLSFSQYKA